MSIKKTISRKDQVAFAREILPLVENANSNDALDHLYELVGLLVSWVGNDDNEVAIELGEYVGEIRAIARGGGDVEWRDYYKKSLYGHIDELKLQGVK